ncbi:hypothetical protein ACIQOW_03675 [Kitasatospora sp. NPDC091335]|uniref:hypothetical protein n=1 Tax=Kitasatospora sp. NPDC091335 TaxID=3364085 RepID=UPI003824E86E
MLDTTLPAHALTGLTAVGWRKPRPGEDGPQPIWPVRGGSGDQDGDDDTGDDQGGDGQEDDGQDDDTDAGGKDDEKDLGDAGKKALRELRKENRALKAQLRQGTRPGTGKKDDDGGDGTDPQALREQAREEARAEVWTERVEAAAIAAAAGRLANPQLAARLLDLSDIPKNDKGRPDRDAIGELIDELIEDEPYLAAQSAKDSGRRFQGGADGGARKPTTKRAASLGEAVAARLAAQTGR